MDPYLSGVLPLTLAGGDACFPVADYVVHAYLELAPPDAVLFMGAGNPVVSKIYVMPVISLEEVLV